ncbi:MAG: DinB family protein [Burkholderiales bacterium]
MKAHFERMARYNAWANARLYAAARKLPDEAYRRNVGAFFGSLHGTLNHLLVTDRIWMRRITREGDHPAKLDAIMFDDLGALDGARKAEDDRILRYVDGLGEEDIDRRVDYATTSGVRQRNRLGDILVHLFNHQTHHRGQAHAILTVLGVAEPPVLDLLAMYREEARTGAPA